jgi:hypothetical protein
VAVSAHTLGVLPILWLGGTLAALALVEWLRHNEYTAWATLAAVGFIGCVTAWSWSATLGVVLR